MTKYCTPMLDICNFSEPVWNDPVLKHDLWDLFDFVPMAKPDPWNFADTNARITLQKFGSFKNPFELVDARVNAVDPDQAIDFDFAAWLDSNDDHDTQSDPAQISGVDAVMNFRGTAYGDRALGASGMDWFVGWGGDDYFNGRGGNDYFDGGSGNDTILGGDDDDVAFGGTGDDTIYGESGNDRLDGGWGTDMLDGGLGDDCLEGGRGDDTITDYYGNNIIFGDAAVQSDILIGSDNDTIRTGWGNDWIDGQDGNDDIRSLGGDNEVMGGTGNDEIRTGSGADVISGGDGNDFIASGDGNDEVCAGTGDDIVVAAGGDDLVDAGDGNDIVYAGSGNDTVLGGDGNDDLFGADGNDILVDGHGNDRMYGGAGDDTLFYGEGRDQGYGGAGDDVFKFADDQVDYEAGETLGRNLVGDFEQDFFGQDTIDLKCVENLTHLSVVALTEDKVRLIGYEAYEGKGDYDFGRGAWGGLGNKLKEGDKIFDIYVYGEHVGFSNGGADGYLNMDTGYSHESGPVCLDYGVLVNLATNDDYANDWIMVS